MLNFVQAFQFLIDVKDTPEEPGGVLSSHLFDVEVLKFLSWINSVCINLEKFIINIKHPPSQQKSVF